MKIPAIIIFVDYVMQLYSRCDAEKLGMLLRFVLHQCN
jgi:hypothetical protein